MAQLNVTELDFENIKQNLKTFLESQSEFSDYDFEGSAMSVLLDTLSYNTHYNAVLAHLLANEAFLDSSIKRASVVSIAKALGYTPTSKRSSVATINFSLIPDESYTDTTYTLSRDTFFNTTIAGDTYSFYPASDVTATLEDVNGVSTFVFNNLEIKQGNRVTNRFLVDANNLSGPFTIPNDGIDTTTLRVRVITSVSDSTVETFVLNNSLLDANTTSKIYFMEENIDGFYVIRFGDNVIGKRLTAGNIVVIDYLVTDGADANNGSTFNCPSTLTGSQETKSISVVAVSSGGAEKESIDSIRRSAPRYNVTKERAVSSTDYQSLILASNPNIQSCTVWGGETNNPPIYGKVFISLDPVPGQVITETIKDNIRTNIITPRCPVAILPEFVDPEYTYIGLRIGVVYDPKQTSLTSGEISLLTDGATRSYFTDNLNKLGKNFYYSRLHDSIKATSASIISVNITPTIQKRITPSLGFDNSYSIDLNSKVQPRELHSTWFNAVIGTATYKVKLQDRPNSGVVPPAYEGTGVVFLQNEAGRTLADVGTINYTTGKISIPTLKVNSLFGGETVIRLRTRPHDDSKDILTTNLTSNTATSTAAVFANPSKNTVLSLDNTVANATTGARAGFQIVVTTDDAGN